MTEINNFLVNLVSSHLKLSVFSFLYLKYIPLPSGILSLHDSDKPLITLPGKT